MWMKSEVTLSTLWKTSEFLQVAMLRWVKMRWDRDRDEEESEKRQGGERESVSTWRKWWLC